MKWSALPQPVAVRLLDLDERVTDLLAKADKADAAVEHARAIINGNREVPREEFEQQRAGFDALYAAAKSTRQRADITSALLQEARTWVERLPSDTRLSVVSPSVPDQELATLQQRLNAMRQELRKLEAIVVPADDIGDKVKAYVHSLCCQPRLDGLGQGQKLSIRWPDGPDHGDGRFTLYLFALLQGDALADAIMRAIQSSYPVPKSELEKRRNELTVQVDELSYVVSAALDKAGAPPDRFCEPRHWLGVKIQEARVNGKAAQPHTEVRA